MNYFQIFRLNFDKKSYLIFPLISFVYLLLASYAMNYRLVIATVFGDFSLNYKFTILWTLFLGLKTALSQLDFYLLIITSVLFGINIVLVTKTVQMIRRGTGGVKLLLGGGSLLAIASTGCTTCGLSLISVLGAGATLTFLPMGSSFIYIFSISLLLFSIFYMLKKLQAVCKIPQD